MPWPEPRAAYRRPVPDADLDIVARHDLADGRGRSSRHRDIAGRDGKHTALHRIAELIAKSGCAALFVELVGVRQDRPCFRVEITLSVTCSPIVRAQQFLGSIPALVDHDAVVVRVIGAAAKASRRWVSAAARCADAMAVSMKRPDRRHAVSGNPAVSTRSMPPRTPVSMLLKSCASPPVSRRSDLPPSSGLCRSSPSGCLR